MSETIKQPLIEPGVNRNDEGQIIDQNGETIDIAASRFVDKQNTAIANRGYATETAEALLRSKVEVRNVLERGRASGAITAKWDTKLSKDVERTQKGHARNIEIAEDAENQRKAALWDSSEHFKENNAAYWARGIELAGEAGKEIDLVGKNRILGPTPDAETQEAFLSAYSTLVKKTRDLGDPIMRTPYPGDPTGRVISSMEATRAEDNGLEFKPNEFYAVGSLDFGGEIGLRTVQLYDDSETPQELREQKNVIGMLYIESTRDLGEDSVAYEFYEEGNVREVRERVEKHPVEGNSPGRLPFDYRRVVMSETWLDKSRINELQAQIEAVTSKSH